ncbi:MAG TPA: NYN domain-containing protein, partial [Anaerolineae bacterium]|nr:NYN domain-containing protein [Anaerolineae bacterium]
ADLYMAISVMDVLHTRPEIETFILLTGDRDFMLLVNHLKQRGKRVVAIGVDGSSSYYLTQAVDDFFYYSEVEEIFEYQPKRQKGRPTNIYDALQQAVQVMREKGRSPRLTNLKPVMVELMGNFDEKSYTDSKGRNFQKFKDFVQEAQRRGTVRLLRRGNVIEVHLPKENIDSLKQLPPVEDIDDDAIDLELAYKLLLKAATEVAKKNKSLRVGMVRNRMKRMLTTFDAARVQNEEGDFPFAKFIGFIKAAEKAGVISIKGSGSRMELVLVDKAPEFDETEGEDENGTLEIGEISDVTPIAGDKAREAVLTAIRAYKNYPTSFLSLAGFVHRHNETLGVVIDEVEARDLMTEAVKGDLLHQIVLKDGRRQYELNDSAEIIAKFLGQEDVSEVETIEDIPEEENAEEETPTSPTFATPYEGLVEAVRVILQDGKDPVLPRVKSTMVNLMGSFSEKEYSDDKGVNFTKFKEFVTDAEARGYVRIQVDGMINRVFLPDSEQTKTPEPETNTEQLPVTKPIHVQPPVVETVEETEEAATSLTDEVVTSEEIDEIAEAIAEMGIMFEDAATANKTESVKESAENAVAISEPIKVEEEQPTVGEPEQRKIVVEGLRTFGAYPAPFMGILAHCRKVRTKHGVTVTSADLRDLLSETVRIGLVKPAPNQKRRPTLYTYSADEALAERYISQEYSDESVAATPSEATATSTVTAPIVTKPEIVSAPVEEVEIAPVIKTDSETDDAPVRQLIIDVLGAWEGYPSTFADLLAEIKKAQAEKGFVVSDSRLRKLLNITTRKGVLVITSPRGIRPTRYAHTGDA